eukprot:9498238-Pyramimonas_sp.AAC.1
MGMSRARRWFSHPRGPDCEDVPDSVVLKLTRAQIHSYSNVALIILIPSQTHSHADLRTLRRAHT